jgi:hypothetical protein
MIYWEVEEAEADFILSGLNGQPTQPWTIMARAKLIEKLTQQAQPKTPPPKQLVSGEAIGGPTDS